MHEFELRREQLQRELRVRGLDAALFFHPLRVQYFSGFTHLSTERPIALFVPVNGRPGMLVPRLEEAHLGHICQGTIEPWTYFEYPGIAHPLTLLADWVISKGVNKLGVDLDGFLDQNGYQGPRFSSLWTGLQINIGGLTTMMRHVKSSWEMQRLTASGDWGAKTHALLQEEMANGGDEIAISARASSRAQALCDAAVGEGGFSSIQVSASFRSGARTAFPHTHMIHTIPAVGDNLVTYCQGIVDGYYTELERTLLFGAPSTEQRRLFDIVRGVQQELLSMIRPGVPCAELDIVARNRMDDAGCYHFMLHHQGHGLGLEFHEAPFLDVGDPTILQEGMVLSVEPGLYVPGLGGFRNSDTVAVTADGVRILTPYPSDIDSLTIRMN
ncbi:MAG TPA: Xaa-Pro peptidase family protein [Bellilinea sp.]|nr:Xaa-Pro peptidase family protein [Bellilinea sp.]